MTIDKSLQLPANSHALSYRVAVNLQQYKCSCLKSQFNFPCTGSSCSSVVLVHRSWF